MDYTQIAYDVADRVATITLDRPEQLNAFTGQMMHELIDAFDRADADDDVRAVVVTGRGRGFCAGADLGGGGDDLQPGRQRTSRPRRGVPRDGGGLVSLRIFRSPKPVIARHQRPGRRRRRHDDAADGHPPGVGAGPHRLRVRPAGHRARGRARRGSCPGSSASSRRPSGCYTGRVFPAEEALAGGLVRSVHPPDELLPAAYALAAEIADNTAPVSVALSRQMMWRMLGADHPMVAHRADSRGILDRGRSADAREGVAQLPREAPAGVPRQGQRRPARPLPGLGRPRLRLSRLAASRLSACGPSSGRRGW